MQRTARVLAFCVFDKKVKSLHLTLNKLPSASGEHLPHTFVSTPTLILLAVVGTYTPAAFLSMAFNLSHALLLKSSWTLQKTAIQVSSLTELRPTISPPLVWVPACPCLQPPAISVLAAQPCSSFPQLPDPAWSAKPSKSTSESKSGWKSHYRIFYLTEKTSAQAGKKAYFT